MDPTKNSLPPSQCFPTRFDLLLPFSWYLASRFIYLFFLRFVLVCFFFPPQKKLHNCGVSTSINIFDSSRRDNLLLLILLLINSINSTCTLSSSWEYEQLGLETFSEKWVTCYHAGALRLCGCGGDVSNVLRIKSQSCDGALAPKCGWWGAGHSHCFMAKANATGNFCMVTHPTSHHQHPKEHFMIRDSASCGEVLGSPLRAKHSWWGETN